MKAIIIDDEPNAVDLLALRLKQHCPQVEVVATFTSSVKGAVAIREHEPDVVFLDIEMPQMNGFQLLESVEGVSFSLIFVTAYDRFALKAFKYSAIDYLLKPIEISELIRAVGRAEKQLQTSQEQIDHLRQQFTNTNRALSDKMALPYNNGLTFVKITEIIYCETDGNYTKFHLTGGQNCLMTKPLKDVQDLLEERGFVRIHRQYLINLEHLKKFHRGDGGYILMSNDHSIPVSRQQKERLVEQFGLL